MARIRFEGVEKAFGGQVVIPLLDLMIEEQEFFTFVGPSGCGKSTILNMIAGLESADCGRIFFDDRLVNGMSPRERDVAMVFQTYALYPHMTVWGNIAFPLKMSGKKVAEIRLEVEKVARLLGLMGKLGEKPAQLSGGERQRVALGRAIVRRPRVFLMDEPLSNLDARLRVEMRAEIKKLHERLHTTTVYVTHDQAEAMGLSDRIAVLDKGRIQQIGTPREVFLRPATVFVAGFMGTPPMNFIPCRAAGDDPSVLDLNGLRLTLEPPLDGGASLLAGIRPEDVVISCERGRARARVSVVEPAGAYSWVDVAWNGIEVKGTASGETRMLPGEEVALEFDPSNVLLFDASDGKRLERIRMTGLAP